MTYFNIILENLHTTTDFVLIYEQACCIHEMLKEIDYWLKMSNSSQPGHFSSSLVGVSPGMGYLRKAKLNRSGDILDFDNNNNESQDDHIKMSVQIHTTQIDYLKTFQVVCGKLSGLFNTF
jgi:hypothetical protein